MSNPKVRNTSALTPDPRLNVQIADSLREQIMDGTLKPGDALSSLSELAESFAVHRQTVQHAMRVLVGEVLVELVPRYGYYVCGSS